MKRYLLIFLSTLVLFGFAGDEPRQTVLNKRLKEYLKENPSTSLFLHLDKNVYSPEENIWFKAYVLAGTVIDNKVLYVRIADENMNIVASDQFPMYDFRSHGNLFIPDTLKEGNYYLYAFTDRMINFHERDVFLQKIRVQRELTNRLEATAAVSDTSKIKRGQKVSILLRVKEGSKLIKGLKGGI